MEEHTEQQWIVVRRARRDGAAHYEVRSRRGHGQEAGGTWVFQAQGQPIHPDLPGLGRLVETEETVRARARTFCARMNAGGIARERALATARAGKAIRKTAGGSR